MEEFPASLESEAFPGLTFSLYDDRNSVNLLAQRNDSTPPGEHHILLALRRDQGTLDRKEYLPPLPGLTLRGRRLALTSEMATSSENAEETNMIAGGGTLSHLRFFVSRSYEAPTLRCYDPQTDHYYRVASIDQEGQLVLSDNSYDFPDPIQTNPNIEGVIALAPNDGGEISSVLYPPWKGTLYLTPANRNEVRLMFKQADGDDWVLGTFKSNGFFSRESGIPSNVCPVTTDGHMLFTSEERLEWDSPLCGRYLEDGYTILPEAARQYCPAAGHYRTETLDGSATKYTLLPEYINRYTQGCTQFVLWNTSTEHTPTVSQETDTIDDILNDD